MLKKGKGSITINLNTSEKSIAVNTIFIFMPLKKDSTTFSADLAPEYLNALIANIIFGIMPIKLPSKAEMANDLPHVKNIIAVQIITITIVTIVCINAILNPDLVNSFFIKRFTNYSVRKHS